MKIEIHEVLTAGTLIGVAQEALRGAFEMAERGCHDEATRKRTREAIKRASDATDDAQRAVNAEVSYGGLAERLAKLAPGPRWA